MQSRAAASPDGLAAFEAPRLRLLAAGMLGHPGAAVALTAGGRGEGVSTVAIGLAAALARTEGSRVLLVDGTPLGLRAYTMLGVEAATTPLRELEAGEAEPGAHIRVIERLGFDLLALADVPGRAAAPSSALIEAWSRLRAGYDSIVVDVGSMRSEAPHLWKSWVDHTVLLLDTTRVTREAVQSQRRSLEHTGLRLAGFILNKRRYHVPAGLYRTLG